MFEVSNWMLKVFDQKKTEKAVVMNCAKSGKKKDDGSYEKGMNIRVILNDKTDWPHEDMTGKAIDVAGRFNHEEYTTKDGASGVSYTIFADSVKEHVWEKANKGGAGNGKNGW